MAHKHGSGCGRTAEALEQAPHRLAHLGARGVGVVRARDDHRRLVERAEQHVGDGSRGLWNHPAGVDRVLQRLLEQAECVVGVGRPPDVPAEHRGTVDEHDPLHLRRRAGIEERVDAEHQRLPRIVGRPRRPHHALRGLGADLDQHRLEQILLAAAKVVVERAAGDAGLLHDLLGADARVAALGEQRAGGRDQRGRCRLALGGLGARAARGRRSGPLTSILSVCEDAYTLYVTLSSR